jgi:hypothetical protein
VTNYSNLLKAAERQEPSEQESRTPGRSLVKRLCRPLGKRRDPDFEQVTAYIKKETHQAVKIELLKNGRQEFSELVEGLLQQWLKACS